MRRRAKRVPVLVGTKAARPWHEANDLGAHGNNSENAMRINPPIASAIRQAVVAIRGLPFFDNWRSDRTAARFNGASLGASMRLLRRAAAARFLKPNGRNKKARGRLPAGSRVRKGDENLSATAPGARSAASDIRDRHRSGTADLARPAMHFRRKRLDQMALTAFVYRRSALQKTALVCR